MQNLQKEPFYKRLLGWIKKHPLVVVGAIIIAVMVLFIFWRRAQPERVGEVVEGPVVIGNLENPTVHPGPGLVEIGNTMTGVSLFFNKPIDEATIAVKIDPPLRYKSSVLRDIPNRVLITPLTNWIPGEKYRITVSRGLKSVDGKYELGEDFLIEYEIKAFEYESFEAPY